MNCWMFIDKIPGRSCQLRHSKPMEQEYKIEENHHERNMQSELFGVRGTELLPA